MSKLIDGRKYSHDVIKVNGTETFNNDHDMIIGLNKYIERVLVTSNSYLRNKLLHTLVKFIDDNDLK